MALAQTIRALRGNLVTAVFAALFLLGLYRYGLPPAQMSGSDSAESGTESDVTSAPISASAPGKIVVTTNNGAPEQDEKRQAQEALARELFSARFPDAVLRQTSWQFSPDTFFTKYISGTLPDVVGLFATELTLVVDRHMAADIAEQMQNWKLFKFLNPRLLDLVTRDGHIYAIPNGGTGGFYVMLLFYNRDMFRAAGFVDSAGNILEPQTWDDFTTYAHRLTDRDRGVAGFGILGEGGAAGWHFLNWVWQAGGDFEERQPGGQWLAVFDRAPAVTALQFVKDLRWKHDCLQRNVLASNDELFQLFASGRIAMAIFTPEYLQQLVDKYGMPFDRIGMCLLPAGPAGRANQAGGSFTIVNKSLGGLHKQRAFDGLVYDYDLDVCEAKLRQLHDQNQRVGIPYVPIFVPEYQDKINAIVNKYRNVPDLSGLMQQAATAVHFEPPYRCQQLYSQYLCPAIQEVLVDPKADCAKLLKVACVRFQERELEPVNRAITSETSKPDVQAR